MRTLLESATMKLVVDRRSALMRSAIWLARAQVLPACVSTFWAVASVGTAMTMAVGPRSCAVAGVAKRIIGNATAASGFNFDKAMIISPGLRSTESARPNGGAGAAAAGPP